MGEGAQSRSGHGLYPGSDGRDTVARRPSRQSSRNLSEPLIGFLGSEGKDELLCHGKGLLEVVARVEGRDVLRLGRARGWCRGELSAWRSLPGDLCRRHHDRNDVQGVVTALLAREHQCSDVETLRALFILSREPASPTSCQPNAFLSPACEHETANVLRRTQHVPQAEAGRRQSRKSWQIDTTGLHPTFFVRSLSAPDPGCGPTAGKDPRPNTQSGRPARRSAEYALRALVTQFSGQDVVFMGFAPRSQRLYQDSCGCSRLPTDCWTVGFRSLDFWSLEPGAGNAGAANGSQAISTWLSKLCAGGSTWSDLLSSLLRPLLVCFSHVRSHLRPYGLETLRVRTGRARSRSRSCQEKTETLIIRGRAGTQERRGDGSQDWIDRVYRYTLASPRRPGRPWYTVLGRKKNAKKRLAC